MSICWLLLLLLASELAAQDHSLAATLPSDFNGDGIVDMEDLGLFRAAFGTDSEEYDLDGDGTVSLEDSFIFADAFGKTVEKSIGDRRRSSYTVWTSDFSTSIQTDSLRMTIRHKRPFGISSLRLAGQNTNFAHPDLPLADWEWVWFHWRESLLRTKLLEESFERPVIERLHDGLIITYSKRGLSYRAIDVEVVFRVPAKGGGFDVEYIIHNGAFHTLEAPYAMLGFPGFSNQSQVNEVSLSGDTRRALKPYMNFQSEGMARNREYELLRQDVPGGNTSAMTSSVAIDQVDRTCRLTTTFVPPGDLTSLFSAHTNKPGYVTSHLYVTMPDLEIDHSRSLSVRYDLSVTTEVATD